MANRVCWSCETKAHHTSSGEPVAARDRERHFMAFKCDECGVMSVGERDFIGESKANVKAVMNAPDADLVWHPAVALGKDYPSVPAHIAAAGSEAHTCHSVYAYRSAILMARAVVEATAKDKGVTTGQLHAKIEAMYDQGLVRELVKDTAHEIRFMGNGMAHGDFLVDVDAVDSEDVLAFMDEVLEEVYQAPARLNARKAERAARKAAAEVESP